MKYCFPYNRQQEKLGIPDEVSFNYSEILNQDSFIKYLQEHAETTVIIDISQQPQKDINLPLIYALHSTYQNIKIKTSYDNKELAAEFLTKQIRFFFAYYCSDWDIFELILQRYHPTDIYVTNSMGFALDKVRAETHKYNCQVRIVPNVMQTNNPEDAPEKAFFIRPEDVTYYENYVDIFEPLVGGKYYQVVYEAYVKTHLWYGNLSEIIVRLPKDTALDGRYLVDEFGRRRVTCDKKCIKGSPCRICNEVRRVAESMKEKNMLVNPQRTKPPMADYTKEQIGFSI